MTKEIKKRIPLIKQKIVKKSPSVVIVVNQLNQIQNFVQIVEPQFNKN